MCKSNLSLLLILLFIVTSTVYGASNKNKIKTKKYKIFISDFKPQNIAKKHLYFAKSIPRSIRVVLKRKHELVYKQKNPGAEQLKEKGFDLIIKGWLIQKKGNFAVEFFVINLQTNSLIILADASGYADRRIFDLIDTIGNNIINILKQPMGKLRSDPKIVSISKKGNISKKQLKGANLSGRNMRGIRIANTDISEAKFKKANLEGASLRNSNLKKTDFTEANLKDADLQYSDLSFVKFINTDLRGTDFENAIIYKTNFTGAKMDYIGDVNIGFMGLNGAYGWFLAEGRIYKNFFLGARAGYSADETNSGEKLQVIPVYLTAKYYFIDKSIFSNPFLRSYIGIGLGYKFPIKGDIKGFNSVVFAGVEIFIANTFSFFAELSAVYNQVRIKPTGGAGFKFYLPSISTPSADEKRVISTVTKIEREQIQQEGQKTQKIENSSFSFIGIKFGAGMSSLLQKADTEIPEALKMGPKLSYSFGARWFLFPDRKIGVIADIEYVNLGGKQSSDTIEGTTHLSYVSFNALFGLMFSEIYFGLGIYAGIPVGAIAAYEKPDENEIDVYEMYKRVDFGGIFTAGYMFTFRKFKMFVGIDFKMSILTAYRELETVATPENYSVRNWSVTATMGFGI